MLNFKEEDVMGVKDGFKSQAQSLAHIIDVNNTWRKLIRFD